MYALSEAAPIPQRGQLQTIASTVDAGIEPEQRPEYRHFSPLSGKPDKIENYHAITISLSGGGNETEASLAQDNNPDEQARKESAKNWGAISICQSPPL